MAPAAEVVHRLLAAGLLTTREVVDGTLAVHDLSRSNPVYLVDAGERRYVAKVCGPERDDLQGSAAVETLLYERISADPVLAATAPVPAFLGRVGDLLVLAPVGEGEGLGQRLRDRGPSSAAGRLLGEALGRWRALGDALPAPTLPARLPWVADALGDSRPGFLEEHPATRRLGEVLRGRPQLVRILADLALEWRREALIHGDVRWDNFVVAADPATGGERVLLIDLEFADRGDPAWDVAAAVVEPLAVAASTSSSAAAGVHGEEAPFGPTDRRTAGRHLRGVAPFLSCFTTAYRRAAGQAPAEDDLRRGVAYVPARLVQAAFQHAAWDATSGLATGLAVAALAAALDDEPHLLAGLLVEREVVGAGRGGRSP